MATACTPANLDKQLKEITDPYLLGVHLEIEARDLEQIEKNHRGDIARQRQEVIKFWHLNSEEECTWGRVADAVHNLGGHRKLEKELRKLDNPGTAGSHQSTSSKVTNTGAKTPALAFISPEAFSDALSPTDLGTWLSQQFRAKGLTLESSLRQKLIDEDINGEAFMELKDKDLSKMGFTKGQRMKMLKMITSVKEGKEKINPDQNRTAPIPNQEEEEEEKAEASSRTPDFSRLKEVTNSFLDLIEWNDGTSRKKLRVYAMTAAKWKTIARKLGLEDTTPGFTNSTAKQHRDDDKECVIEVFGKWFENANGLPFASRFPKSWKGLHTLLVESELGEVAKELYTALNAANSSVMK